MHSEAEWRRRRLHFVGIGGSGMSGLALVCATLGSEVTGSDLVDRPSLASLRARGIPVSVGHAAANVPPGAELVRSTAVKADNVERARARELGLRELRRGELLAELSRLRRCVAIAGTHGKTTTTWMTAHALREAGVNPGYVIGAELRDGSPSASWEPGEWLVIETDESDRTFLALEPEIAVVTNVAFEHANEYASLEDVREAFRTFIAQSGRTVIGDQPGLLALCGDAAAQTFDVSDVRLAPEGASFCWRGLRVQLRVPGAHNVANAAAALETCRLVGVEIGRAAAALATFPGAKRRLELVGETPSGARVYDDYAIHANEVRATVAALRTVEPGRVVAVFEPVLFTRTRAMAAELGLALTKADALVVLELFPGSERGQSHPGVSGKLIAEAAREHTDGQMVVFKPTAEDAQAYLEPLLSSGDACVVMGCGFETQRLAHRLVGRD